MGQLSIRDGLIPHFCGQTSASADTPILLIVPRHNLWCANANPDLDSNLDSELFGLDSDSDSELKSKQKSAGYISRSLGSWYRRTYFAITGILISAHPYCRPIPANIGCMWEIQSNYTLCFNLVSVRKKHCLINKFPWLLYTSVPVIIVQGEFVEITTWN